MYKKAMEGGPMWTIGTMMFVIVSLAILIFVFLGPGQLLAKTTKPAGDTASGLSSDCDNDGVTDTVDRCPCSPNVEPDEKGSCGSTTSTACRKKIEEFRKGANDCIV